MQQILHIFKKDVRRHWPEILISLALLGLYARIMTRPVDYDRMMTPNYIPWAEVSESTLAPLMLIFWIFLTIRVVQGERLVGDTQWWITKPYEWWKLLAAKEFFLLAFIGAPLFLVQLYILRHAGFAIHSHFFGVVRMQFALALILFLPAVALASLTKNLGQALIVLLIVFILFSTITSLLSRVPNSSMSSAVRGLGEIESVLMLGSIIGAAGWQYARRKTWASRGSLAAGAAVVVLISAFTPYAMFVNRKYPMPEPKDAPAQISAGILPEERQNAARVV
jgi:ABC-type transport system involved in multi-copper enzyme maturation permease subunit